VPEGIKINQDVLHVEDHFDRVSFVDLHALFSHLAPGHSLSGKSGKS
jgi:hypothetical protein